MFKFDLHVFDMSSNQENAKWVKILSKTNRLLSRQTPFNRCPIKLVTLVSDNYCQNSNWLSSRSLYPVRQLFFNLWQFNRTWKIFQLPSEEQTNCSVSSKYFLLVFHSRYRVSWGLEDIKYREQLKNQAWCSENPALYLSCCGCWLFHSSIRLKEITQFLRIHLR